MPDCTSERKKTLQDWHHLRLTCLIVIINEQQVSFSIRRNKVEQIVINKQILHISNNVAYYSNKMLFFGGLKHATE